MENINEFVDELVTQYNVSKQDMYLFLKYILQFNFVYLEDEKILLCLERYAADMSDRNNNLNESVDAYKSTYYIESDALYRTYGEDSIPYLDEEYVEQNSIRFGFKK